MTQEQLHPDGLEGAILAKVNVAGRQILVRMLGLDVGLVGAAVDGSVGAELARVRFDAGVTHPMTPERIVITRFVLAGAEITAIRFVSIVLPHVELQHGFPGRLVVADLADVWLELVVHRLDVFLQAFGIRKESFAEIALLFGVPSRQGLLGPVHVDHRVIPQLSQLPELFMTN